MKTREKKKVIDNNDNQAAFVPGYLLYLLAAASEAASMQFHSLVRDHGLRVPEWRVLACLTDQDGEMITHLADFALIEQSRLTRIIDQMQGKGWVTRKTDADDRRRVRVYLTRRGAKLANKLVQQAREHEQALLQSTPTVNASELRASLRALLDTLGD